MKFISSILLLLLFVCTGSIQAAELPEQHSNINLKLFSTSCFAYQNIGLQEGILDVQETNEMDGFEVCFMHPAPASDPLRESINIKVENNSVIVPVRINSFFIDLPPPLFS